MRFVLISGRFEEGAYLSRALGVPGFLAV